LRKNQSQLISTTDLLLLLMAVTWGANFAVVKQTLREMLPLSFNAIRFSLASIFLLFALRILEGGFLLDKKDLKGVFLLGLVGHTFYQLLFINGIAKTTASLSALIMATSPLFVVFLGSFVGAEKISRRILLGVLLSLAGVFILVSGSSSNFGLAQAHIVGGVLTLAAAVCWAAYTVFSKPYLARYSPLRLTVTTMVLGTIVLDISAIPSLLAQDWRSVTVEGWTGLAYSFGLAIVVGYVIWEIGVHRVGPGRTAVYQNLIPVIATAMSCLWLGETIAEAQIIGAGMVFLGIYLARRY